MISAERTSVHKALIGRIVHSTIPIVDYKNNEVLEEYPLVKIKEIVECNGIVQLRAMHCGENCYGEYDYFSLKELIVF